jgi:hypothetical protein
MVYGFGHEQATNFISGPAHGSFGTAPSGSPWHRWEEH